MSIARRLLDAVDALTSAMAYVSGAVFLVASFYITLDVLARKFLSRSSGVTDEMGGYALALGGMFALAYTLRTGGHVRIDVLLPKLPVRTQRVLGYGATAIMVVFAAVVALYCWRLAWDSWETGATAMSFLQTPLVVPQALMAFGMTMLAVEALAILLVGVVDSFGSRRLVDLPFAATPEIPDTAPDREALV
jgi:TRAP-type C4-dicarboxylate transport system permease small subunit